MELISLPKDILVEILLYIPTSHVSKVCLCCHHLRRLCSNNGFWQQRFLIEFPDRSGLFEGEKEFTNYWLKQRFLKSYPDNLVDINFIGVYKQLIDFKVIPVKLDDKTYIISELMPRIIRKLRLLSKESCEGEKLYFAVGDSDSTMRRFDRESLYLQLGVQSNSEDVALILLALLKFMINPNCYGFSGCKQNQNIPVAFSDLLDKLKDEATYGTNSPSFELDEPLVHTFRWGNDYGYGTPEVVNNTIDQVDIWTLERVEKAVYDFNW